MPQEVNNQDRFSSCCRAVLEKVGRGEIMSRPAYQQGGAAQQTTLVALRTCEVGSTKLLPFPVKVE